MNVDIKDFQYKILEIAFYFDEFCKKYDIEYYLMGGSALEIGRASCRERV